MENTITDSKETIFEAQEQIDELKPNGTHR